MKLAIVGADESKFTERGMVAAKEQITLHLAQGAVTVLVSGHCPKGGVDIWAEEEAIRTMKFMSNLIFHPKTNNWTGYRARNIQIAEACDKIICITPRLLPIQSGNKERGLRYTSSLCHHCVYVENYVDHVQNGGCWTLRYASRELSKPYQLIVVEN